MKAYVWLPMAAGAVLLAVGLAQKGAALKGEETLPADPKDGVIPKHDASAIPTHTEDEEQERQNATYCQLLEAYRSDLAIEEAKEMQFSLDLLSTKEEGEEVCEDFAWNATWTYKYGGLFGSAGWTELKKDQPAGLLNSCLNYVKGEAKSPGTPSIKPPPKQGANFMDQSWHDVKEAIVRLMNQVADARPLLDDLRDQYLNTKKQLSTVRTNIANLWKKINDLNAQGVECGLA